MTESGEQRSGKDADDHVAPLPGDPAGREHWDLARRELTVVPPALASIVHRARTSRGRLIATVAAVAAVSATIIVVPLVGSLRAEDPPPAGPAARVSIGSSRQGPDVLSSPGVSSNPAPPVTAGSTLDTPLGTPSSGQPVSGTSAQDPIRAVAAVVSLSLSDPGHGFAVSQQCDDATVRSGRCRYGLWRFDATAAQPWTAVMSPVPDGTTDNGWSGDVLAFSADRVLIHSVTGDRQQPSWFSADGGRTWTNAVKRGPLAGIPAGGRPAVGCIALAADLGCDRTGILIDLPDGSWAMLAAPPGVTPSAVLLAPDGRWWLVGTRGDAIVAGPTPDSGRTWLLTTVATTPGRSIFGYQLVFAGPSVVWLEVIGQHPDGDVKNGLLAIRRSIDGGRSWGQVWTAATGTEPRTQIGAAIGGVASLQLCTELGESYRITSTGLATALTSGCTPNGWRQQTIWGYLEHPTYGGSPARISADGVHWTELPALPEH